MSYLPSASRRVLFGLGLALLPAILAAADPLDTDAATPALDYQSPIDTYQAFRPQSAQGWRAANDLVGRIGGWRTYAQEPWETPVTQAPAAEAESSRGGLAHGDHHDVD